MKVHFEVHTRKCGCGDSFCGDCREHVDLIACGAGVRSSDERTRDVSKVTCAKCTRTKTFKDAQDAAVAAIAANPHLRYEALLRENVELKARILTLESRIELAEEQQRRCTCAP